MSVVAIVKVENDDAEVAVWHAIELTHGLSVFKLGAKVLLKPNLVKPVASGAGIVTDVRVLGALSAVR